MKTKKLHGKQATTRDIQSLGTCFDNSFAVNILDNSEAEVAKKKFKIVSAPFKAQVNLCKGKPIIRECVLVSARNKTYRVLNSFIEIIN